MTKKRILIVDDMRTIQLTVQAYLGAERYDFDFANDGITGLETAVRQPPHIIISDVQMPDMDGFELCRRVRAEAVLAEVPVLLISAAWDDPQTVKNGIAAGAAALIPKPLDAAVLIAAVGRALGAD